MENASKALIIAGAILISIVLVSVGVIVVQSLDPSQATESMDSQAVQAFNSKFDPYLGTNVSGTNVRSLLTAIQTNNTSNTDDTSKQVTVLLGEEDITANINAKKSTIGTTFRYTVKIAEEGGTTASGTYSKIVITKNT